MHCWHINRNLIVVCGLKKNNFFLILPLESLNNLPHIAVMSTWSVYDKYYILKLIGSRR